MVWFVAGFVDLAAEYPRNALGRRTIHDRLRDRGHVLHRECELQVCFRPRPSRTHAESLDSNGTMTTAL